MQDLSSWAEHLDKPLVLIAFIVMLFVIIVITLIKTNAQFIKKILPYVFIFFIIVIACAFVLAFRARNTGSGKRIIQETKGGQSPSIVTKGKDSSVNITYGGLSKKEGEQSKATGNDKEKEEATAQSSRQIEQKTEGTQSPAVVSGGDVTINFNSEKP